MDAAAKLLNDCINDGRAERLNPEQALLLARMGKEKNCHALMHYFAREAGYSDPMPVEPEDELAALLRGFGGDVDKLQRAAGKIERLLATMNGIRRVG